MTKLFKKTKAQPPSASEAVMTEITKTREQISLLEKKQNYIDSQIEGLQKEVRLLMSQNKKRQALEKVKAIKRLQSTEEKLIGMQSNLQSQCESLENAIMNAQVLKALNANKEALKNFMHEHDLDMVEDLMDEIAEVIQEVNEISEALARPIGPQFDEDELDEELAAIMADENPAQKQPTPVQTKYEPEPVAENDEDEVLAMVASYA